MTKIPFIKMHGAGNDFVFLEASKLKTRITPKAAALLLDRHFGIGGDQLLLLSSNGKGPKLDIFNSDGSLAEMCGNGVRAVANFVRNRPGYSRGFTLQTKAGPIGIAYPKGGIEVDMGRPILEGSRIPVKAKGPIVNRKLKVGKQTFRIHGVSMGNPHCVIYVKNVDTFPVREIGPQIENHPFFPRRVNVEFAQVLSKSHVKARVWERGAGETLACGTGACAVAVASARAGKTGRAVSIDLPGGRLRARWAENDHVFLGGPAEITYRGEFYLS